MVIRNFFAVCILRGIFAVMFSNLVNDSERHQTVSRFDEIFWLPKH